MTLWESRSGADGGSPLPATGRRPCAGGFWSASGGRLAPISEGAQAGPPPALLEALLQPAPPLGSSLSQEKPAPKGGGGAVAGRGNTEGPPGAGGPSRAP